MADFAMKRLFEEEKCGGTGHVSLKKFKMHSVLIQGIIVPERA